MDKQEMRAAAALAPNWWKPFKCRLVRPLVDSPDGSVYGALLCVAGHSLSASTALARDGCFVEYHLFNPPSVSLAMCLRKLQEKAAKILRRYISGGEGVSRW
ncbi:hypothetical protein ACP4OV_006895 [Aristida adscensionis]